MTRYTKGGSVGKKRPLDATKWEELKSDNNSGGMVDESNNNTSAKQRKTLKIKEKHGTKEKVGEKVCYNCHKTGHLASDCSSGSTVKQMKQKKQDTDVKNRWMKEKRSEWRRQKRNKQNDMKKCCFNCRKPGHQLAECPEIKADNEQGTGICFKCGSTEHSSGNCRVKLPPGEFPYAKCFVCGETGHLSRQCPDNPRGLYPNGGCCNMCASVEHLKRDCPEFQKQQGIGDMTLERMASTRSVDAVEPSTTVSQKVKQKGPKVVKF